MSVVDFVARIAEKARLWQMSARKLKKGISLLQYGEPVHSHHRNGIARGLCILKGSSIEGITPQANMFAQSF